MEEIVGTIVGRWYVTAYGTVFVVLALRQVGLKCTVIYAVIAVAVGALAENGSVHLGIPYTRYAFNPDLRGHELWVGEVPLMVPLSYTFMAYFAFAATRFIVAGPYWSRSRQPVFEYVLAVVLATWALWIIDPVSRLGRCAGRRVAHHRDPHGLIDGGLLALATKRGQRSTIARIELGLSVATRHT